MDPDSIEAIARRVAEILEQRPSDTRELDAGELARRFGIGRTWIYANAQRLGAIRLGDGPRPRLRFDPDRVADLLGAASSEKQRPPQDKPPVARPPRERSTPASDLLPIGRLARTRALFALGALARWRPR